MNGILLVDKPKGMTSHDVVAKIRKLAGIKKVGHTGTLDPNATGLLVICLGEATKLIQYLEESPKEYLAEVKFGSETDTDDVTGDVIQTGHQNISLEKLKILLPDFLGEQDQVVPIYSAKKVNGKKLYDYARDGQNVELPTNRIAIHDIEIMDSKNFPESITIRVNCSKGTYIRSLIRDLGRDLTSLAHMGDLRRNQTDSFDLQNAVRLEDLNSKNILDYLIPLEEINLNYPEVLVSDQGIKYLRNGNQLYGRNLDSSIEEIETGSIVSFKHKDHFLGLGKIQFKDSKKVAQPIKVLNIF